MGWATLCATIPIIVVGLTVKHFIKGEARNLTLTAWMLIIFAIVLAAAEYFGKEEEVDPGGQAGGRRHHGSLAGHRSCSRWKPQWHVDHGRLVPGLRTRRSYPTELPMSVPAVAGAGLYELYDARHELAAVGIAPTLGRDCRGFCHRLVGSVIPHEVRPHPADVRLRRVPDRPWHRGLGHTAKGVTSGEDLQEATA